LAKASFNNHVQHAAHTYHIFLSHELMTPFIIVCFTKISRATIVQSVYYQGYKLDEPVNGNPIPSRDKRFFSSPQYPDHLWHSTSLQCYGHHKVIPQGYSRWGVKLTTHFYVVPPLPHMPLWHAVTTLPYNF